MQGEVVVLLHGLARSASSMKTLAAGLKRVGYDTLNYNYPSTKNSVEILTENVIADVLAQCSKYTKIHFVTHSMGGILVRQYLSKNVIKNLGRVVMLGPPNQGSQVVDKLKHMPGYFLLNGPAGMQLGTDRQSIPSQLGVANFELGVIAGSRSINILLSTLLPKPDDGKVSVENTKLEGMADHITLPVTHPLMMKNQRVIEQVIYFLQYGVFHR